MSLVTVENLSVSFPHRDGSSVTAVDGISFNIDAGSSFALVGESGSGKSLSALSLVGLTPPAATVCADALNVAGVDVLTADQAGLRTVLLEHVGLVFQNPMTALNPRITVFGQLSEALGMNAAGSRASMREAAARLLQRVGIRDPSRRMRQFPHELSGGLAQRVVIAMALARGPSLLIADEPTTALDARIQAQILDLIDELRATLGLAVLLVSHDLAVVADRTDEVAVMRNGKFLEIGATESVLAEPQAQYTRDLLAVIPRVDLLGRAAFRTAARDPDREPSDSGRDPHELLVPGGFPASGTTPLVLEAKDIRKVFGGGWRKRAEASGAQVALDGVSLSLNRGDSLGIVGESGSGKTTLARILVGLETATSGEVTLHFDGGPARRNGRQSKVQYVFQDTTSSLDPHMRLGATIGEFLPSSYTRADRVARIGELLSEVGLPADFIDRYPRQLSGGQRQRVGIARALAADPEVVVADEPVSALDVSVQATVINLLNRLRNSHNMTFVVISHDIGVVSYLCNRLLVVNHGVVQEAGYTREVLASPSSDYTRELLSSVPGERVAEVAA